MDLDAERCLLGSILRDPDVMGNAIMIIKDESFFYLEKHQLIWTALCTLNRNVTPIDLVTLAAELETMDKLKAVVGNFGTVNPQAVIVGLVCLAILIAWPFVPKIGEIICGLFEETKNNINEEKEKEE
jgi:hypothetical protein